MDADTQNRIDWARTARPYATSPQYPFRCASGAGVVLDGAFTLAVRGAGAVPRDCAGGAGHGLHQGFVDAALEFLEKTGAKEGFAVDYIRTTDPITDDYLAQHKLFVQLNYPPYRWTPVAEAAFKKAMEQGTIGYIGFHHATLLGKFDGFEMSPFFHDFMGRIQFKSYIPEFATGTVHVEAPKHPVMKGLPKSFVIENDEWYTYDRRNNECADI